MKLNRTVASWASSTKYRGRNILPGAANDTGENKVTFMLIYDYMERFF